MNQSWWRSAMPARVALVAACAACFGVLCPETAQAGGFEVGENTTLGAALGGTGVALREDAAAAYFNPARLGRRRGFQLVLDANMLNMNMSFKRDPIQPSSGEQTFDETTNQEGFFPIPFLALSYSPFEDFAVAFAAYGLSSYGRRCYGKVNGSDCELVNPQDGARYMLVGSNLLQVYLALAAGYQLDLGGGKLGVGASVMAVYQKNTFRTVINSSTMVNPPRSGDWPEGEASDGLFTARDVTDWKPNAQLGLSYEKDNMAFGLSYRLPIKWEGEGKAEIQFPESLAPLMPGLEDDKMTFGLRQAGVLRVGWGARGGTHPGFADRPRWSLEANVVWEDWSKTETFDVKTADLTLLGRPVPIEDIQQYKGWSDVFSLRLGTSWAPAALATLHAGAALETATQRNATTNVDFIGMERYTLGGGATIHALKWLDVTLAYQHIFTPGRTVTDGSVYPAMPTSKCIGPAFDDPSCSAPGQPPGNPQNQGRIEASYQLASLGLALRFD